MPFSGSEKTRLGLYGATSSPYSDFSGKSADGVLVSGTVAVRPIGLLAIGTLPGGSSVEIPGKCSTWTADDNGRLWTAGLDVREWAAGNDARTWKIPGKCK